MNAKMDVREKVYIALAAVFVGCLVISTVVARKPIAIFGMVSNFGALPYVFTFIITDIVAEVWGKDRARLLLISGLLSLLVSFAWTSLALAWPAPGSWEDQRSYEIVMGNAVRVMIAGLLAFLVAQFYDVWAFLALKRRTRGRYLWLRTNVSTIPAQIIDTCIFVPIAFGGVMPIGPIFTGILTFKLAVAVAEQFIVYLVVWLLRSKRFSWARNFHARAELGQG